MSKLEKLLARILGGGADANVAFADLCQLLRSLGFVERTRGSHHIFSHPDIVELINLQAGGAKAKPYQVKQVRAVIARYGMEVKK